MTTATTTTTNKSSSYITQLQFAHALAIVRAIPQNSSFQPVTAADKLQFYGLYKQATEGDVNIPRPSSRQVVDYAKWKAWCRMKGITPIEAQKLYVDSLIQLLTELVHRYPRHEQTVFLKKALHSLEFDHNEEEQQQQEEEFFQDAYDDTEFELQEHFLNHIEPEHLMQQDILLNSPPPTTPLSGSFYSNTPTPQQQQQQRKSYRQNSFSDVNSTTEYPITPITSPGVGGQSSVTGQWVLNQLQQHNGKSFVHPMDFLQQQQHDMISEADTCDREVAAATANLILSSPRQSPYTTTSLVKQHHSPHLSSTSTTTTTTTSSSNHAAQTAQATSSSSATAAQQQKSKKKSKRATSVDTRALEKLQTEVTALTEQIDRMRRDSVVNNQKSKNVQWMIVLKTVIKYLMANSAIFLIIFFILWKKKSPIAYKIINAIMPFIQLIIRKIIRRVVFWKITV